MALTDFQRRICRLVAETRIASGESYVAGGVALGAVIATSRISRDIDVFHDTEAALEATWEADRRLLQANGLHVNVLRERASFVEARISSGTESVLMEWARDSAFRFFPLVEHEDLGLTLHPFDLATNKVLALVGRLEVRDWVDVIECDARIQGLGYLAWAACGKDPGFGPRAILEQAARSSRYSAEEVRELEFAGPPPDAAALSRAWHGMLDTAQRIVTVLPSDDLGTCVLGPDGALFKGDSHILEEALRRGEIRFHRGTVRGALPRIVNE